MPENTPNLDSLFEAASKIKSPDQRAAFLDKSCGDDLELRKQIEQLLQAEQQASGSLAKSVSGLDETIDPSAHSSKVTGNNLSTSRAAESDMDFSMNEPVVIDDSNRSVLRSLGNTLAEVPQVSLHKSAAQGDDPIAMPSSPEMPHHDSDSRYRLDGEIARGGMGAIIKGRDTDLGRDLAIKVLLDSHKDRPEVIQRFVEEAQINGQLQHPGIAPVYELGQFKDKRPFFAMKLVKGQTLSKLLSDREEAADARGKFIGIFEQICQTMGYAHSRGVIHRDLKPANIMVGAFGEVQVMDWGLAKVLQVGGVADEKRSQMLQQGTSIIRTLRSSNGSVGSGLPDFGSGGSAGSHTQMGSVMGTPAYMPPEQALGEIDNMDERADVFGLGAILCEILTGKPPYVAENGTKVYRMASRGKLGDAFSRLDSCGADPELIDLTKECLELEPVDRPRNAGVLAERMTEHLQSVQQKLQEAEVQRAAEAARADAEAAQGAAEHQRAEAESARATAESKRRRTSLALATSLLLLVGLGSGGWLYLERGEANRQAADAKAQRTHAAEMQTIAEQRDVQRKTAELAKATALTAQQQAELDRNAALSAKQMALTAKQVAQDAEERSRQLLYATDMQLAPLIWADENATVPQFLDRLDRHDPKINVALEGKQDLRSFEWYYNKHLVELGAEIYAGHSGPVTDAALTADGKFITLDSTWQIRHWDRVTRQPKSTWDLKKERSVRAAILSSNGQWVAARVGDEVQVLDVDTRELRFRLDFPDGQRPKMMFSQNCKIFVVANGSQIRWWDTTDGRRLGTHKTVRPHVRDRYSISQDGLAVVQFSWALGRNNIYRLDLTDEKAPNVDVASNKIYASALEFFPDGRNFVTGSSTSGLLSIYNADSYNRVASTSSHTAPIYSFGVSSDGKKVACAANNGVIKIWGVEQTTVKLWGLEPVKGWSVGQTKDEFELKQLGSLRGHRDEISRIFFSPDKRHIVSCGADSTARIWDLERKASSQYRLESSESTNFTYSPDGLLIAGAADGKIDFWDAATGRKVQALFDKNLTYSDVVAFSPDHRLIAVGSDRGSVWLWDLDTGLKVRELRDDSSKKNSSWRTRALAFSPDGKLLVTAFGQARYLSIDRKKSPNVWDVSSGQMVAALEGHSGEVRAVQFSGDGSRLATGSHDGTVRIWDTTTWQTIRDLRNLDSVSNGGWDRLIQSIAFSKDGNRLALNAVSTESERKRFYLWDAQLGDELVKMEGHANTVQGLSFSPNGRTLASVSRDKTLRLWNVATREELMKFDLTASSLSFSPDGDQLLASRTVIPTRSSIWQDPERAASKLLLLLRSDADFASRIRLFSENLRLHESLEVLYRWDRENRRVQAALAATRANWHASHERWAEAADEFSKLQTLDPTTSHAWLRTAGLLRVARALFEQNQAASASELVNAARKQWRTDGLKETKKFSRSEFGKQVKAMRSEVQQRLETNADDDSDENVKSDGQIDNLEERDLLLLLAEVEGLLGDVSAQIEAYTAAIESFSNRPANQITERLKKLYQRRGDAYMIKRKWQMALDDYDQVVTDNTKDKTLLASYALAMANVLLADPKDPTMEIKDPWMRLAIAQEIQGKKDLAIQSFDRALQTAVGVQAKQAVLEQANRSSGFAEQLAANHPRDAEIQYAMSRICFKKDIAYYHKKGLDGAMHRLKRSYAQLEATLAINPSNAHAAQMLTELKMEIDKGRWIVLTTTSDNMKSAGGADLELLDDGSILASGENPKRDTYAITTNVPVKRIRAIRLEVIPDASLPRRSHGRSKDGRFCLNEFRVLINGKPRRLDGVVVSNRGVKNYQQMISGKTDRDSWELKDAQERQFAVMLTDLELAAEDTLTFELVCSSSKADGRNLGRFRLSVSDDPETFVSTEGQIAAKNIRDPVTRLEIVNALVAQKDRAIDSSFDSFNRAIKRTHNVKTMVTLVQIGSLFDGFLSRLADQHSDDPDFLKALGQFYAKSDDATVSKKARPLLEAVLDADPQDVSTAHRLAELLVGIQSVEDESQWKVMKPNHQDLKSEGGATLTILDDGSILASGTNADQDAYRMTASQLPCIKAIRLEVLPDPSLPKNGPGRYPGNGNFHLSELNVLINGTQQSTDEFAVSNAAVSNNDKVQAVLNGSNSQEYWGVYPRAGQRSAAFVATDLELTADDKLTLELLTSRGKYPQHNLGRFRLSVTDNPDAYANALKRFAYQNAENPWTKLAIAYDLIGDKTAYDKLLKQHPQAAPKNLPLAESTEPREK